MLNPLHFFKIKYGEWWKMNLVIWFMWLFDVSKKSKVLFLTRIKMILPVGYFFCFTCLFQTKFQYYIQFSIDSVVVEEEWSVEIDDGDDGIPQIFIIRVSKIHLLVKIYLLKLTRHKFCTLHIVTIFCVLILKSDWYSKHELTCIYYCNSCIKWLDCKSQKRQPTTKMKAFMFWIEIV